MNKGRTRVVIPEYPNSYSGTFPRVPWGKEGERKKGREGAILN